MRKKTIGVKRLSKFIAFIRFFVLMPLTFHKLKFYKFKKSLITELVLKLSLIPI